MGDVHVGVLPTFGFRAQLFNVWSSNGTVRVRPLSSRFPFSFTPTPAIPAPRHSRHPVPSFPAPCPVIPGIPSHHSQPLSCHSRACRHSRPSVPSFPRRRESGRALHAPSCECTPVHCGSQGVPMNTSSDAGRGDSRLRGNDVVVRDTAWGCAGMTWGVCDTAWGYAGMSIGTVCRTIGAIRSSSRAWTCRHGGRHE